MSDYKTEYAIRYTLTNIHQQIEVAAINAANKILTEDDSTPNHADRVNWANFVLTTSIMATEVFKWPVAQDVVIQDSVKNDQTGDSVPDTEVQRVVNANVDTAIAAFKTGPYYKPPTTAP